MNKLAILLILLVAIPAFAQNSRDNVVQIAVDSAWIRAAPAPEAEAVGSVFANDSLVAVGRNVTGDWLEVRRPFRRERMGWIARQVTIFSFEVGRLPITDTTTGVTGAEPVVDTGFAVLLIGEAALRAAPDRRSARLDAIPIDLTLPVIERTPDNQWLRVNYRGTSGWIMEYLTRTSIDLITFPVSPQYAGDPRFSAREIIPLETQLAQIDRLVAYITPIDQMAQDVSYYWQMMIRGETVECKPPAGNYGYFSATARDLTELPEMRRQERLLTEAIDSINDSIEAMRRCGIYLPREMRNAYGQAVNAHGLFETVLARMENLRDRLIEQANR